MWTPGDFWYCVLFGSLLTITVRLRKCQVTVKAILIIIGWNVRFWGVIVHSLMYEGECAWQWRDWYDFHHWREQESGTWTPRDFCYCVLFGSLLMITVHLRKCQVTVKVILLIIRWNVRFWGVIVHSLMYEGECVWQWRDWYDFRQRVRERHVNSRGFLVLCTIWLPIDDYCTPKKVSSHC